MSQSRPLAPELLDLQACSTASSGLLRTSTTSAGFDHRFFSSISLLLVGKRSRQSGVLILSFLPLFVKTVLISKWHRPWRRQSGWTGEGNWNRSAAVRETVVWVA
jgi:hypothetical protein